MVFFASSCKSFVNRFASALKLIPSITVIGQAVLEILHFKVDIPRKSPRIRISLKVSVNSGEQ